MLGVRRVGQEYPEKNRLSQIEPLQDRRKNCIRSLTIGRLCGVQHKRARTICSAKTTRPHRTAVVYSLMATCKAHCVMNGHDLKMSSSASRNMGLTERTAPTCSQAAGPPLTPPRHSNSRRHLSSIKTMQPTSQLCQLHITLSTRTSYFFGCYLMLFKPRTRRCASDSCQRQAVVAAPLVGE